MNLILFFQAAQARANVTRLTRLASEGQEAREAAAREVTAQKQQLATLVH